MTHAVQIREFGGPDVLKWTLVKVGTPGPNEARIRQTAVGLNFADTYMRNGVHHVPIPLPTVLGVEAAGVIEEVGTDVHDFSRGDRVVYSGVIGAYAEERLVPAAKLFKLPDNIDDGVAAAVTTKGRTAQYLCRRVFRVKSGDVVLIHAAAGGLGMILAQWTASLGAIVIGTVSTDSKAEIARANGCRFTIVSTREDFVSRVAEVTDGKKVSVVYDSLGKDTVLRSLECIRPRGMLISYGQTTGFPPPIDLIDLMHKGSLVVTKTQSTDFTSDRGEVVAATEELFEAVISGKVKPNIHQQYALKDVAQAHRDLEARKTVGSSILIV
jgi:NADPH2:quinone reductase